MQYLKKKLKDRISMENKIKEIFEELSKAKSICDLDRLFAQLKCDVPTLEKCQINSKKYPTLDLSITKQEIYKLKKNDIIKKDNSINIHLENNTLAKLLYSILWKQGDVAKVKHIVAGILAEKQEMQEDSLIFYQFGKYLSNKGREPIIDQHVLRVWGLYKPVDEKVLKKRAKKALILSYKKWLNEELTVELKECADYLDKIDKLLYSIGKYLKRKTG